MYYINTFNHQNTNIECNKNRNRPNSTPRAWSYATARVQPQFRIYAGSRHGQGQPGGVQTEIWVCGAARGGARAKRAVYSATDDF